MIEKLNHSLTTVAVVKVVARLGAYNGSRSKL